MKKIASLIAMAAMVFGVGTATAADTDGKFGVGAHSSLTDGGVSGLGVNYWIGDIKAGLVLDIQMVMPDEGDAVNNISAAVQGLYAVARSKDANLNTGLRINLNDLSGPEGTDMALGIEIPVEAEYWVTEHVTVTAHVGLAVEMPEGAMLISIGAPGFAGGAGFNFFF